MPKANGNCDAGNQTHIKLYWKIDSESLIPIKKRPTTHNMWSLSYNPSAKNICPKAQQKEILRSKDLKDRPSITTARISGGISEAKNLIEKYMLNWASVIFMYCYISVCRGAGPFDTNILHRKRTIRPWLTNLRLTYFPKKIAAHKMQTTSLSFFFLRYNC